jgi:hypothetical protein
MGVTGNDGTPANSSQSSKSILRIQHPVLDYAAWKGADDPTTS